MFRHSEVGRSMPRSSVAVNRENSRLEVKRWHNLLVNNFFDRENTRNFKTPEVVSDVSPKNIADGFRGYIESGINGDKIRLSPEEIQSLLEYYIAYAVPAVGGVQAIQMIGKKISSPPKFAENRQKMTAIEFFNEYYSESCRAGLVNTNEIREYDSPLVSALYKELDKEGMSLSEFIGNSDSPSVKILAVSSIMNGSLEDAAKFVGSREKGGRPKE